MLAINRIINMRKVVGYLIFNIIVILTSVSINKGASASHSSISKINDITICQVALSPGPGDIVWNLSIPISKEYAEEAKHRGLSTRQCARLSGYFSENRIRQISGSVRGKLSIFNQTEKMTGEIKSLQKQLSTIRKELIRDKSTTKGQLTLSNSTAGKIKKFEIELKEVKKLKIQNEIILSQFAVWQELIPKMTKTIKKLGLDAREKAIRSQELISNHQDKISELSQKIDALEKTNKVVNPIAPEPQIQSIPEPSDFRISDYLLWVIPLVLLLASFCIIIVVLLRKNSETKRQLEDSMRYASRNKKSGVLNEEKSDSE